MSFTISVLRTPTAGFGQWSLGSTAESDVGETAYIPTAFEPDDIDKAVVALLRTFEGADWIYQGWRESVPTPGTVELAIKRLGGAARDVGGDVVVTAWIVP
jgi:hypothetical protein